MKLLCFIFLFFLVPLSFAQEDEEILNELEAQRAVHQKEIQKIEESPALTGDVSAIENMSSEQMEKMFEEALKNNPLKGMDREAVKSLLKERVKGQPVEKIFKTVPVTLEIMVDMVRDEKVMQGLVNIMKQKEKLRNYAGLWLLLVVVCWVYKRRVAPKTASFKKRFIFKTAITLLGSIASFGLFYVMFSKDIDPFLSIILKNLL